MASTYLRLLRGNSDLIAMLQQILGTRTQEVLESEFVYQDDIETVFEAVADSGMESWVLRYGDQINIASHGPLGFAVLSAPDLHTALDVLSDYSIIRSSTYRSEIRHSGNRVEFIAHDLTGNPLVGRWLVESGFSVAQQLIETIMAHPLGDNAVITFAYPEPAYKSALEDFFGVRCEFDAPRNSISIPASWCRISSPLSDPESFRTNLQKCRELKLSMQGQNDIVESTRLILKNFFEQRAAGALRSSDMPTLTSLAERHNTSTRTYARRLKEARTNYKNLLEDARREQAQHLLTTTYQTIAEIADNLAYQEPANFVRAFKTWFDMTPTSWRRKPGYDRDI